MRRHPLLWKLALLQVGFCLLLTWLIYTWGLSVERSTYFLAPADRSYLADYARQAEDAWHSEGAAGAERFRKELSAKEDTWVALVGPHLESLGSTPLSAEESSHLTFMRKLDWPMSRRLQDELPYVSIEFPGHPEQGRLVIQLPERLLPGGLTPWTHLVTHGIVPTLLAALLGLLLYRHLVVPLNRLRDRADALRADELESTPLAAPLAARRDELGELAQALEHMAERLRLSLAQQRLLLRTLSHELRTPLARLRIAHDSELPPEQLRQRLDREIGDMQRLLEDTLDLAWMDTERPQLPTEPVLACRCGKRCAMTPVSKAAGTRRGYPAAWASTVASRYTWTAWPRPWKTSCATPSVTRPRTARSASTASARATSGTCACRTRALAWRKTSWNASSSPTSAWTIAPAKVSASAWRSPGAPSSYRAAGSGPATASPDCACTCGCRRPPEGEVFRKLMRFTLK